MLGVAISLAPPASLAAGEDRTLIQEAGLGFSAAIASLIYAPIKLVYAIGGLVVGSLAWVFSGGDGEVAGTVFTPSLRGDYVVSPEHLTRQRSFDFFGREPAYLDSRAEVAAAPADSGESVEDWDEGW